MIWGFNTWGRHGVGLDPQQGQLQVQAGEGERRWDSSGHPDIPQIWHHVFSFWGFLIWVNVDKNKDQQHTSYLSFLAHTPILIAHNYAESRFFTIAQAKDFVNCQIWKVLLMHCVRYTAVSRTVKYVTNWSMWQKYGTMLRDSSWPGWHQPPNLSTMPNRPSSQLRSSQSLCTYYVT